MVCITCPSLNHSLYLGVRGDTNIPRARRVGSFLKEYYDTVNTRKKNEGWAQKHNRYLWQEKVIIFPPIEIFLFFPFTVEDLWVMSSGENKMDLVKKLAQAGSWHPYCWHLPWACQKGNYKFTEALLLFFIQNEVTLDTMFSSLNPQSIDSPAPTFQKYLSFSSVFSLNGSHTWLRISADTIHHPHNPLVNHKALLYILMTGDKENLILYGQRSKLCGAREAPHSSSQV